MKSRDFCFWLQGFFELTERNSGEQKPIDADQARAIRSHLALVFKHEIDPSMGPKPHQDALNDLHEATNPNVVMRC